VADTAQTIIRTAKERISEIDKELEKYDALRQERGQLEKMVNAADGGSNGRRRRGRARSNLATKVNARSRSGRAPRGANKQAVIKAVSERPGASTGEVLTASGVEKRTGYTTLHKANADGLVKKSGTGYEVTDAGKKYLASL
jgi:hypothetical protein